MATPVEAVLKAQGYTTFVSPPGADKGVDILAAPGALGFGTEKIVFLHHSGNTRRRWTRVRVVRCCLHAEILLVSPRVLRHGEPNHQRCMSRVPRVESPRRVLERRLVYPPSRTLTSAYDQTAETVIYSAESHGC
jgi:hypothetical protein